MSLLQDVQDRRLGRVLLGYLAGAWIAVEIAGFLTDHYGWPPTVVDLAVLLAASGGLVALTVSWYHGEAGRQRMERREIVILSGIAVVTLALGVRIGLSDPHSSFLRGADHLLIVEFPLGEVGDMRFSWRPQDALSDDGDMLIVDPAEVSFELEGLEVAARERSAWLRLHESDLPRVYLDIPRAPSETDDVNLRPSPSQAWSMESLSVSVRVARDAAVTLYGDSTVVRILAR